MSNHAQNPSAQSLDRQIDGQGILPSVLSFEGAELKIIDREGRPWLAAADLARALGYARADKVTQIYERHASEFSDDMTGTLKLRVKGFGSGDSEKPVRIFSPRGCHLVAMFSRTAKAAAFRRWVLDVLEQYEAGGAVVPAPVDPMPGFGSETLHDAALDLIHQAPALLLRDVRLMVSWDFEGKPQASAVDSDTLVVRPSRLAGVLRDPFTVRDEYLPEIIEAASQRLAQRARQEARMRERGGRA